MMLVIVFYFWTHRRLRQPLQFLWNLFLSIYSLVNISSWMLINSSPFQSSDLLSAKRQFTLLRCSNSNNVITQVQAASEFLEAPSDSPVCMGVCSDPLLINASSLPVIVAEWKWCLAAWLRDCSKWLQPIFNVVTLMNSEN